MRGREVKASPRADHIVAAPRTSTGPEGEKLHKLLAQAGLGSRREIEGWIAAGRVTVNGATAVIGARARPGMRIEVDGRPVDVARRTGLPRVLLYHKPAGEIVSVADPEGRPTVFEHLPRLRGEKWIAVGRLDFNTMGLLIFTTSGELAARLMHPRYEFDREYAVRIAGEVTPAQMRAFVHGVQLDDGPAKFESIESEGGEGLNRWYRVVLKEGRYREVRRMFESQGLTVSRLIRTRFGPISLPSDLPRGRYRDLGAEEIGSLMTAAGFGGAGPREDGRRH